MRESFFGVAITLLVLRVAGSDALVAQSTHWLDQPLQNWNQPGAPLPAGSADAAMVKDARDRCRLPAPGTPGGRALSAAGWIAQPHLDRELVKGEIEILAGAASLDSACAPQPFNLFVFVAGRFAGTLSPTAMSPGADGYAGPVRFSGDGIAAEFARYKAGDAACCPSARMAVQYQVDNASGTPSVVPTGVRITRSY
jgi:hypothetical protein